MVVVLSLYPLLLLKCYEKADVYMPRLFLSLSMLLVGTKLLGISACVANALQNAKN